MYAIGSNNFIFDKTQRIHLTANELASAFGISTSTAGNKAAEIKKMFKIDFFSAEWLLPELIDSSSMVWMVKVNGLIVDVRDMSLEIQQQAFEMGIIPYVPGEEDEQKEGKEKRINTKPTEKLPQKSVSNFDIDDDKQLSLF